MGKKTVTIFLSYCSKDSVIADLIESYLKSYLGSKINISRYTRDVGYRESFKKFMQTVSQHDFVLCIVSDNYLKSAPCLYEIGETLRNRDYENRLLFVVLNCNDEKHYSDLNSNIAADIYTVEGRINYIKFWENEYYKIERKLETIDNVFAKEYEYEYLKTIYKSINFELPEFMSFLADRRGIPFDECIATDFENIITSIDPTASNIYNNCLDYHSLLLKGIQTITKVTRTDYNQIILHVKKETHGYGLVVFADYIAPHKQRYRIVAIDGLIGKTFDSGQVANIGDTIKNKDYFPAVLSTKSELLVPIRIDDNTIGIINSESDEKNHYTQAMIQKLEYLSRFLAIQLRKIGYNTRVDYKDIPYVCSYETEKNSFF